MRGVGFLLVSVVMLSGVGTSATQASGKAEAAAAPYVTEKPAGYRDWKLISVAHEEGNFNSLGAILGNAVAIRAFRDGTLPFPDGTMIAALHYHAVPSELNNRIFGKAQSIVPGSATNVQFMIKDSKKYAATGGWGFGHFNADGKPAGAAFMQPCFGCHEKDKAHDLVFTQYAH